MKIRKHIVFILLGFFFPIFAIGQELNTRIDFDFFFDNTEFERSTITDDQTMGGINIAPEIGLKWDKKHHLFGGINIQKHTGSKSTLDKIDLIGYYEFKDKKNLFRAGLFRKKGLLNDFNDQFIQDSILFFKPVMQGIFYQRTENDSRFNIWLDWIGLPTQRERESFLIGTSGYKTNNHSFYTKYEATMFHLANNKNIDYGVVDNFSTEISLGYIGKYQNAKLDVSLGVLVGYENDRLTPQYNIPIGIISDVHLIYKKIGVENRFYYGQKRMTLYESYSNQLYWGNPFYRSHKYLQNKFYWKFIDNKYITGKLISKIHWSEKQVFFEQMMTISARIELERTKNRKKINIFE